MEKKNFNTVATNTGSQMICEGCSFLSSSPWIFTWEMCVRPLKDYQAEDEGRRLSVGNPASDALGHCCDTLPITSCRQWYRRQPSRKQWDTLISAGSRFQPCEGRNTGGNAVTSLEANVTRQELGPWMHRLACMSATAWNALQTEREGGNDPRLFPILNCQSSVHDAH